MTSAKPAASLGDIARALGVSAATVSNALTGKGRVSASLVPRVRETAARMGYVPSSAGRALRTGRSCVIGLVLPDIGNPLFPQFAQAIEQAARAEGYGVLIGDSHGEISGQTEAINRLIGRGVDGIVVVPRRGTRIADLGCPVVMIDSPSTPGNTVSADHWQAGVMMGKHLSSLGHKKALLIGGSPSSNVQNDRIGGLREGLSEAETQLFWVEPYESAVGAGALLGLAGYVASGVTAFASVSDLLALRALTELHREGFRVPEEASVTGFDDLAFSAAIIPALTTLRMDMPRIAEIALRVLVEAIDGAPPSTLNEETRVPMTLIQRQSSGPAPSHSLSSPAGTLPC